VLNGTIRSGSNIYGSGQVYGAVSYSNFVALDRLTSPTVTIDTAGNTSLSGNLNAGSYTGIQRVSTLNGTDAANYIIGTFSGGDYEVSQLALTGAAIAGDTSVYGDILTPGAVSFTNVVGSDIVNSTVSVDTSTLSTGNHAIVGDYTQTASSISGTESSNYSFAGFTTADNNYQITQRELTGAAIANNATVYGDVLTAGAVSFANIVSGDAVTSTASVNTNTLSTGGQAIVGDYTQTVGSIEGADKANYSFSGFTTASNNYSITQLMLNGAIDSSSNVYGSDLVDGGVSYSNLVASDLLTAPTIIIDTAGNTSLSGNLNADSYTGIQRVSTLNGTDAANYSIGTFSGGDYEVSQLALTGAVIAGDTSVYADALTPGAVSFSNIVSGDTVISSAAVDTSTLSTGNHAIVGDYTQTASSISGTESSNYSFAGFTTADNNYQITQRELTGAAIANDATVYGDALTAGAVSFANIVSGDVVTSTASVDTNTLSTGGQAIVGDYTQTVGSIEGDDKANYSFGGFTTGSNNYSITQMVLNGVIGSGSNVYGSDLVDGAVSYSNLVASDLLTAPTIIIDTAGNTSLSGNLNAGSYTGIQRVSTLNGTDAANYSIGTFSGGDYDVSKLALTGSITTGTTVYGDALVVGTASFTNKVGVDNLGTASVVVDTNGNTSSSGNFIAGIHTGAESVSALSGSDVDNYTFSTVKGDYIVNQADLSVAGVIALDKIYDGTNTTKIDTSIASLNGAITDDIVSIGSMTGTFLDKNAGDNKVVNGSEVVLFGSDGGNYNLIQPTGLQASISKRALTVSISSADDKVYDSATDAIVTLADDRISGDQLSYVYAANFIDKNVGDNKFVSVRDISLTSGADLTNYTVNTAASGFGAITAKAIAISGITAGDKTYDAKTVATIDVSRAAGWISGDDVTVAATGAFDTKDVDTDKTVALSASYGGADESNYIITDQSTTTSDVTAKAIAISGITAGDKTYDAKTVATIDVSRAAGWISGDDVTVAATGAFDTKDVGTDKTVALSASYGGADESNYIITDQSTTTSDVTAKAIAISGITAGEKIYDANTVATIDVSSAAGWISGDDVTVAATGAFDTKDVGTDKTVALSASYGGADESNYIITDQSTTTSDVTAKAIAISGITAGDKTYDANTLATIDVSRAAGWISGDDVTVAATGAFDTKDVGTDKTVALSATYGGADESNYIITDQSTTTSDVTAKAIAISGITAGEKIYDANTVATIDVSSAAGWISGDDVTVAATGAFDTKHAGTEKTVNLSSAYGGADESNYVITDQSTTTSDVTAKAIFISGITADDKTYDANTVATIDVSSAAGWINGDDVTVAATGEFDTKDVGTDKTVALSASYGGADESNYAITDQTTTTADVQPIKMGNVLLNTVVTDVVNTPASATGDMTVENINSSDVGGGSGVSSNVTGMMTGLMTGLATVADAGISSLQAKDEKDNNGE
jgi:DNA mismatch repair protein MutH